MEELFDSIMEKFQASESAFLDIHNDWRNDIDFALFGNQWDAKKKRDREVEDRSSKVYNKCSTFINYVVNQSIKSTPTIKTISNGLENKEKTKVIDGLIKYIQTSNNASDKYNRVLQDAVAGGIGVIKIDIAKKYGKDSITIEHIKDPTSVYPDPEAQESDLSDAKWLFFVKSIPEKEFRKLYPDASLDIVAAKRKSWFAKDSVQIAEYWEQTENGVVWYLLNGNEILDSSIIEETGENVYPGKCIPFAFITGIECVLDGTKIYKSLIRDIKSYQEEYNYLKSEKIDFLANSAKSPWLATPDAVGDFMEQWENANRVKYSTLFYKKGEEKPTKIDPPAPPVGLVEGANTLEQDMRSNVGIRDPLLDIPATNSGKAVQLQISQGNIATIVWQEHLNTMIKHIGKIIVELIPFVYNYPHIQQIIGSDGQYKAVPVQMMQMNEEIGEYEGYDLAGDYDVIISTGPSYVDQKAETYDKLIELTKAYPQLGQIGLDIIVQNLDIAESVDLAERIRATMPPQVLAATSKNKEKDVLMLQQQLAQISQQAQQMQQVLQQMAQENANLKKALDDKQQTELIKIQSTQQIANQKSQTELIKNTQDNNTEIEKENIKAATELEKANIDLQIKQLEMAIEQIKASAQQIDYIPVI